MYEKIPVVPLRGLVVLPGELLHFDAGREKSVAALQAAVKNGGMVLVSCQRDAHKNEAELDDIYNIGTLCKVRQILCLPGNSVRVLVEGTARAALLDRDESSAYLCADVATLGDLPCDDVMAEALMRRLKKAFRDYASASAKLTPETVKAVEDKQDICEFVDAVANIVLKKPEDRQRLLEECDVAVRAKLTLGHVLSESEIVRIDRSISQQVKAAVDKNQKEYYLREQMRVIKKELGEDSDSEADLYRERMEKLTLPEYVRERLEKEINRFAELPAGSHEGPVAQGYIECILKLPWSERSTDDLDIQNARKILDEDHYGLEKVKQRIIEHIAVSRLTGAPGGQIICFVGPPGVGKTSISKSIARALGRKFVRMSLGGVRDEAEIRGHRRTYIGAMPGRVISAMQQAGTINPVMLFDEIDKLASDYRGDPASAMLEVLDSAQNFEFCDHYLEIPYDLSKVMFITTANDKGGIPAPLLDRMEIIDVPSYLEIEKMEIAKRHLIPKQLQKHGLKRSMLTIPDALLPEIIRGYTAEAGVRELERTIGAICRKAACDIGDGAVRVRVSRQRLNDYLGVPKHTGAVAERDDAVGMANGLAWTAVGGVMLEVETQTMPGTGQLSLTGKLGDVMQESAKAALTYIRAHAGELGIAPDFIATTDIHVHVPEGAVPKDGPSAGVTIMTSMASALTGIPVRAGVGMTGEITLRGRVLPIGGLREKLLAAVRAGITTVAVPADNRRDMQDVPEEVKAALHIVYAADAMTVLKTALRELPHGTALNLPRYEAHPAGAVQ